MFQFTGFAHCITVYHTFSMVGCPIRISTDQNPFAVPRSFSQLSTSFFASESLGIPHTPLMSFILFSWILLYYLSLDISFSRCVTYYCMQLIAVCCNIIMTNHHFITAYLSLYSHHVKELRLRYSPERVYWIVVFKPAWLPFRLPFCPIGSAKVQVIFISAK